MGALVNPRKRRSLACVGAALAVQGGDGHLASAEHDVVFGRDAMVVELVQGRRLHLEPGFDAVAVARLVATLERL